MTKRLMTDRDHLVSILESIELLAHDADIKTTDTLQRLLNAAARAAQDVYPAR
jgi:hypothetical protein